ncbi:serine hydrolase [Altericroceibacterium spongiae]|nr:serine hydrolase [Altericroceibacterium spongiae]
MKTRLFHRIATGLALATAIAAPAQANEQTLEAAFDTALGTDLRAPRNYNPDYSNPLEQKVALLANGEEGRIGVAAIDLSSGHEIAILGNQRFPMASTSKIAIAATFLDGVDKGKLSLTSEYPLMIPVSSKPFSSKVAPVRKGQYLSARRLMELMLTRSSNSATDALLAALGGPDVVSKWVHSKTGITDFQLSRDIATLVRDDGEIDPVAQIDPRDSATPLAMVQLLKGLYQGEWLSEKSRRFLIDTMEQCRTGRRRIPALMPEDVTIAHKTGSLHNTSSDIGILTAPNGKSYAVAIYVTGQGTRANREAKIAHIARAIYDGYSKPTTHWVNAEY